MLEPLPKRPQALCSNSSTNNEGKKSSYMVLRLCGGRNFVSQVEMMHIKHPRRQFVWQMVVSHAQGKITKFVRKRFLDSRHMVKDVNTWMHTHPRNYNAYYTVLKPVWRKGETVRKREMCQNI
jgi:hypothetical protein